MQKNKKGEDGKKGEWQCSCNAASCRFRVTNVAMESQNAFCVCIVGLPQCQQYKNTACCTKMPLCRIFVAGKMKRTSVFVSSGRYFVRF